MAKSKTEVSIRSFGVYEHWDPDDKSLPRISQFTLRIPAQIDIEFGFVANIKGAKNQELTYCIDHPGILAEDGSTRAPFDGVVYVKTNDWDFYLGDTIWEPITDKLGSWKMTLELSDRIVAEKIFEVFAP